MPRQEFPKLLVGGSSPPSRTTFGSAKDRAKFLLIETALREGLVCALLLSRIPRPAAP